MFFIMRLVLLPTSLAQHCHGSCMAWLPKSPNCNVNVTLAHYCTLFCIGNNWRHYFYSKTIINGEMLGTPTQCHTVLVICDDVGQNSRKHVSINSFLFDTTKHHYRNLRVSLIASCTDLNFDSGSNLKYWLRLPLLPKMQTPQGHGVVRANRETAECRYGFARLSPVSVTSQIEMLPVWTGAVHKWRHTILGKNLPPTPLVTFRHKCLTPLKYNVTIWKTSPPYSRNYKFPSILRLLRQKFHLFHRFDLCKTNILFVKTSKILHTLLSKN